MQRRNQLLGAGCAVFLAVSTLDLATAGTPPKEGPALITMSDANGFVAVAERPTAGGAVVGTFRSDTATVTVIGRRGSSISFHPSLPTAERPGMLRISMATARPKTAKDATAYRDSGRSVVDDLVALGMPRGEAEREFGTLPPSAALLRSPPECRSPSLVHNPGRRLRRCRRLRIRRRRTTRSAPASAWRTERSPDTAAVHSPPGAAVSYQSAWTLSYCDLWCN